VPIETAHDRLTVVEGSIERVPLTPVLEHEELGVLIRARDLEGVLFEGAEDPAEFDLIAGIDVLTAKEQDGVFVPERLQLGLRRLRDRLGDVEADDFGADVAQRLRFE